MNFDFRADPTPFETAIIAYSLHLLDSEAKNEAYEKLKAIAKADEGKMWWPDVEGGSTRQNSTLYRSTSSSASVEATAYALMTLVKRNEIELGMSAYRWLVSQQNSKGGFSSTQDTVIGLESLGSLAGRLTTNSIDLNIKAVSVNETLAEFNINDEKAMLLQEAKQRSSVRLVDIKATGHGFGIVQVSWQYNMIERDESDLAAFKLQASIINSSSIERNNLHLKICSQ